MAKKLSKKQVTALCNKLLGTTSNIYVVAPPIIGREPDDDTFDQLREAGIFRCVECNEWQTTEHAMAHAPDLCEECDAEMNSD